MVIKVQLAYNRLKNYSCLYLGIFNSVNCINIANNLSKRYANLPAVHVPHDI